VYRRRDYNPDGWRLSGRWEWRDADQPAARRVVLSSPARAVQAVNWVTVHNPQKLSGWPDAGGFPTPDAVRSTSPLALVRDLTLRVRLAGKDVPKGAVTITAAWADGCPVDDPLGSKRSAVASVAAPEGTYPAKEVTVTLPAAAWLAAAKKDAPLPMAVVVEVAYADKQAGSVEVLQAELTDPNPAAPNLLPHGGFEAADTTGYPTGWSRPRKYRYFPPGVYYIFNTWHNASSHNRGTAARPG